MRVPLAVLIVEDSPDDVELLLHALRRGGYEPEYQAVASAAELRFALADPRWQLVVSDWSLPGFNGLDAFELMRGRGLDLPFIILSGTISEEIAVEALRAGVHDFMTKDRLLRLIPAVARELAEADSRRQRRLAEAELAHRRRQTEESERLLRLVIESVPDAVAVMDNRGEFLLWNRAAEAIVATIGKRGTHGVFHQAERNTPSPDLAALLQRVARGDTVDALELFFEHPELDDGRFYTLGARPLRDGSGQPRGVVAVFHDVSGERASQEQLMIADRMAALGMLAAGIGHEINNPLAAVMANLQLAVEAVAAADDDPLLRGELTQRLHDGLEAAERVRQIARDLRVFARQDGVGSEPVDVNQVLESSLRMARHQLRERARVVTDFGPQAIVSGVESRLGQVFLNLLVNAAQAIAPGQPEANTIRVATRADADGSIVIAISDTGSGMSDAVRSQLFKPFFTTKSAGFGTGLGLAICQRIVHECGGRIEVDSMPGQGSTFRVWLPRSGRDGVAPRTAATRRGRLLVVDDEPLIAAAVAAILGAHEVQTATSAGEALDRLQQGQRFDLILSDLAMPGISGIALHQEMQQRFPDQADRMLFLTGGAGSDEAQAFVARMRGRIIDKPFDHAALVARVEALLAGGG
jgi:signal transduction histidine kinase